MSTFKQLHIVSGLVCLVILCLFPFSFVSAVFFLLTLSSYHWNEYRASELILRTQEQGIGLEDKIKNLESKIAFLRPQWPKS